MATTQASHIPHFYTSVEDEYEALTKKVAWANRTQIGRFWMYGKDALDLLNRISTKQLNALKERQSTLTILTTNKGRIVDLLRVVHLGDRMLVFTALEAKENVISAINFFSFDEDIVVEDCTELTELYALIGPQSSKHIASLSEKDFITPSVNNASIGTIFDLPVVIVRTDYLNICSYEVLVISPGKSIDSRITETRIPFAGTGALEICRIENGLPIFGSELGERFNPLEAGLMDAVSFDKGCYVGQEVVARLNTYDKVKRQLIQLDWNTAGVKTGDAIFLNDQQIGELTSFVRLPNSTYIGLGYCSRKSNPVDVEIGLKRTAARVLKPIN